MPKFFCPLTLFTLFSFYCWATPAQIIVIRHGEKPSDPTAPGLTSAGLERSGALAYFFQYTSLVLDFGLPVAIYTFKPYDESHRGVLTIAPTAQALGIPVHSPFRSPRVNEIADLVLNDPLVENRMVLICWDHSYIPDLITALRGPSTPSYPGSRYDLVYKLTYTNPLSPDLCVGLEELMNDDSDTLPMDFLPYACP